MHLFSLHPTSSFGYLTLFFRCCHSGNLISRSITFSKLHSISNNQNPSLHATTALPIWDHIADVMAGIGINSALKDFFTASQSMVAPLTVEKVKPTASSTQQSKKRNPPAEAETGAEAPSRLRKKFFSDGCMPSKKKSASSQACSGIIAEVGEEPSSKVLALYPKIGDNPVTVDRSVSDPGVALAIGKAIILPTDQRRLDNMDVEAVHNTCVTKAVSLAQDVVTMSEKFTRCNELLKFFRKETECEKKRAIEAESKIKELEQKIDHLHSEKAALVWRLEAAEQNAANFKALVKVQADVRSKAIEELESVISGQVVKLRKCLFVLDCETKVEPND